mmetsp:Transcript_180594/g.573040  ORF Transcript_180594/g.573040 Transcript_180594/m.573040 type:complete len:255 (-) Transcript_180594:912-1676(-)
MLPLLQLLASEKDSAEGDDINLASRVLPLSFTLRCASLQSFIEQHQHQLQLGALRARRDGGAQSVRTGEVPAVCILEQRDGGLPIGLLLAGGDRGGVCEGVRGDAAPLHLTHDLPATTRLPPGLAGRQQRVEAEGVGSELPSAHVPEQGETQLPLCAASASPHADVVRHHARCYAAARHELQQAQAARPLRGPVASLHRRTHNHGVDLEPAPPHPLHHFDNRVSLLSRLERTHGERHSGGFRDPSVLLRITCQL